MFLRGFYFITDSSLSKAGIIADIKNALRAKVGVIQYRRKNADSRLMYKEAFLIRRLCKKALFIVNDRVDIALAVSADGVHLGQDDLPIKAARKILGPRGIIGITVHGLKEARLAERKGADYLGVSPIFKTTTKEDAGMPAGIELIKRIKKSVHLPLVAIGGINLDNAPLVIGAGADALCAINAIVCSRNVKKKIEEFQVLFKKNRRKACIK